MPSRAWQRPSDSPEGARFAGGPVAKLCNPPWSPLPATAPSPHAEPTPSHAAAAALRAVSGCFRDLCGLIPGKRWAELCDMYILGNKLVPS